MCSSGLHGKIDNRHTLNANHYLYSSCVLYMCRSATMDRVYLSIPCASSFCERIFSTGEKLPGQCESDTIERRVQLAHNLHIAESGSCALLGPDLNIKLRPINALEEPDDEEGTQSEHLLED